MKGLNISRLQEDNKGLQNLVEQKRAEARVSEWSLGS